VEEEDEGVRERDEWWGRRVEVEVGGSRRRLPGSSSFTTALK
jgi:hypothetical protein